MRTFNHTVGWAVEWVRAEGLDLESFLEAGHSYQRKILLHPDGAAAEVVFRLTGKGLKGYTQYGIEVVRLKDYYACRE